MKTALIIGAGKIGTAITLHLIKRGYSTRLVTHAEMDLTDLEAVRRQFYSILPAAGLDCLVNAAGTYGAIGNVSDISPEDWTKAIAVNLIGVYACCHYALPRMNRGGHIITLAGGGADPIDHLSGYGAAKAGLARLVLTMAKEYPDLRINLVSPGPMLSRMQLPLLHLGRERGGSNYDTIRRLADTGEGAIPIDNTLRVIDTLLAINPTGQWYAARHFTETPIAA